MKKAKIINIKTEDTRLNLLSDSMEYVSNLPKEKELSWLDALDFVASSMHPTEEDDYTEGEYNEDDYWDEYFTEHNYWGNFFGIGRDTKKKKSKNRPPMYAYDDDDDDCFNQYGSRAKKKIQKKNKKSKVEESILFDEDANGKEIRFYRDYHNQDDYEVFDNLYSFDEFCTNEGIQISDEEVQNLILRDVSYCAIDPQKRIEDGILELKTDSSYGGLKWECATYEDEIEMYR